MRFVLFVVCIFIANSLLAQVPEPAMLSIKYIGGNYSDGISNKLVSTNDGGFVLSLFSYSTYGTGTTDSFCNLNANRDIFVKYDASGTQEWAKCFLRTSDTFFYYCFPQVDGGIVYGGMYSSPWGIYLCKQDVAGNIVWSHGYSKGNSLQMGAMVATDNGGFLISAYSYYTDTNAITHYGSWTDPDILLIKVDGNGDKEWCKVIGGTGTDAIESIVKGPSGSYYLSGFTSSNDHDCTGNHGGNGDAYLVRIDKDGNIIWHKDLGGGNSEDMAYITSNGNLGVLLTVASNSSDGNVSNHKGNSSQQNIWLANVDSNGNVVWDNCYGGGGYISPKFICSAADNSTWIAGISGIKGDDVDTAYGQDDALLLHIKNNGDLINAKVMGSSKNDRGMVVHSLSDGRVLAGGFFDASDGVFGRNYGGQDVFLAEFAPWNQTAISALNNCGDLINVYPNPASGQVKIEANDKGDYRVRIANVLGRTVFSGMLKNKIEIDVRNWPKGIYLAQISNDDGGEQITYRIVLQ